MNGLQPWLSPWADALVRQFPSLRVTSTYRSYTEQLSLWNTRSRSPYPIAPPGRSWHGYGRAWDMVGPAADLATAGAVWRSWGGTWGGGFGNVDPIHFQA